MQTRLLLTMCALVFITQSQAAEKQSSSDVTMYSLGKEAEQYWPRWRGPSGQGIAKDGTYPDAWSSTKNVLWKVDLPGEGNSSPIVWGDRIFLTTARDEGERRSILCLRRKDGKLLWEADCPKGTVEKTKPKNGFTSGTPSTDGERIYAYFGNFGLLCVDFDGKKVWHKSFGEMNAYHGTSCSPLLYRDKVIVYQDHRGPSKSFVVALDKKTGKQLWKTDRKEKVGWGSPIAISVDGKGQIIVSSQKTVYAYDPADGKELWTCKGSLYEVTPTPVVGFGMVFCCSGRRGPTLAIRPTGKGDITKTHLVWKVTKGSPFVPSPMLYQGYIYMVDDILSIITCYNAKTGDLVYRERLGSAGKHGFSASPVAVNGKIFFTNDDGETFVVASGPKFQLLHINSFGTKTLASPALVDGKWYFRTGERLLCIGK